MDKQKMSHLVTIPVGQLVTHLKYLKRKKTWENKELSKNQISSTIIFYH